MQISINIFYLVSEQSINTQIIETIELIFSIPLYLKKIGDIND